jgi:TRAP-type C4-dicarboxylate transport system permease small subunit
VREKVLRFLQGAAAKIDKASALGCGVLLGIMTLTVLVGVLFRYVFFRPLGWTEELSRYLMIWTASLAITVGIYHGEHIGLTFLPDKVTSKIGTFLLGTLINLLVLGFLIVMIKYSLPMAIDAKFQIAQSLPISMVIPTLAIPVSMGLDLIQLLIKMALSVFGEGFRIKEKSSVDI